MSMSKRKREERLKKRQEELLSLQERSAPKRVSQPKQTQMEKKMETESQGRKSRADTKLSHHTEEKENKRERAGSRREAAVLAQERVMSQQQSRKEFRPSSSEDSSSTQTPTLRNNDFVPFMRTEDDELLEGRLSVSPAPAPPRQVPKTNDALTRDASRASRNSRQSNREMVSTSDPSPGRSSRGQGSNDMMSQSISGLSHREKQRNVPAAMRSSFAIGGMHNGHDDDFKRKEKQLWLEDLERQKREAKEKKEQEKASDRAAESAVMQHWAEPVEHPQPKMISRMDNKVSQMLSSQRNKPLRRKKAGAGGGVAR
eukprot:XP_011676068.1 PREDICTED: PERQ amino acid-rich with GYF domain-containing protein 2-like [Strongylocentrotus purpuratus]